MRSTLFVVCLALALISTNALGSMGGGFRGGSAPRMSSGSHSAPRISAPRISAPSHSAPRISAPRISTPSAPRITAPKISTPVRTAPKVHTPIRPTTPKFTAPKVTPPRPSTPLPVRPPTPKAPVHIPKAPVQTPKAPIHTPKTPVQIPKAPVQTPKTPVQTPKAPVQTPKAPTPAPVSNGNGLSLGQLQKMMPQANAKKLEQYAPHLNKAMQEAGINTPARQDAFLAQLGHESGQFKYMEEIASGKKYEGRCKGLGNCSPGDGVKYKGRGPIQITGKANYAAAGKALGLDLVNHPELASTPEVGFRTAAWYWNTHHLNKLADKNSQSGFTQITKAINGGTNGAPNRNKLWKNNQKVNPAK